MRGEETLPRRPEEIMDETRLPQKTIDRLCLLNARLEETRQWAAVRFRRTLAAYSERDDADQEQRASNIREDYEAETVISCSLGGNDPDFNREDEGGNVLARVCARGGRNDDVRDEDALNWNEGVPQVGALRRTRFGLLFHEIFNHQLHCDAVAAARIGEIQVDLIFTCQGQVDLDPEQLPGEKKDSYPYSVFSRLISQKPRPLTACEQCYARRLDQAMRDAGAWLDEQAQQSEEDYRARGSDGRVGDGGYEECVLRRRVDCVPGENHPEYMAEDDNILVTLSESLPGKNQRICDRFRHPFPDRFGLIGRDGDDFLWRYGVEILPCRLFCAVFDKLRRDWLKMLSIGGLWLEMDMNQRRIVQY
jgi:hypothetical protein